MGGDFMPQMRCLRRDGAKRAVDFPSPGREDRARPQSRPVHWSAARSPPHQRQPQGSCMPTLRAACPSTGTTGRPGTRLRTRSLSTDPLILAAKPRFVSPFIQPKPSRGTILKSTPWLPYSASTRWESRTASNCHMHDAPVRSPHRGHGGGGTNCAHTFSGTTPLKSTKAVVILSGVP